MSILCKFYNSAEYIKNGLVKQEQRYKCKSCKGNFVNSDKRQKYT